MTVAELLSEYRMMELETRQTCLEMAKQIQEVTKLPINKVTLAVAEANNILDLYCLFLQEENSAKSLNSIQADLSKLNQKQVSLLNL